MKPNFANWINQTIWADDRSNIMRGMKLETVSHSNAE